MHCKNTNRSASDNDQDKRSQYMGPIVLNVNFVFITQMEANNFLSDVILYIWLK